MKTKLKIAFILTMLLLGFFYWPLSAKAAAGDIVISEIGAYEASDQEWLEIFNKGNEPVDLTGWKFYEDATNHKLNAFQNDLIIDPGEYAIVANVADKFKASHSDFTGTIIDSSWSSLKESGEEIGLKNASLETIELFTYLPCPDTSLQRIIANLNDYTAANWQVHTTSNSAGRANEFPNNDNSGQNPPPGDNNNDQNPPADNQPPDNQNPPTADPNNNNDPNDPGQNPPTNENQNSASQSSYDPTKIASTGSVLINEFVADPEDGEEEWIELYNNNLNDVDLTGWKILDGAGTATALSGIIGSNPENRYLVITKPKGRLNNSGDAIILKNQNNDLFDTIYYGNWKSPYPDNNAPAAQDPNSVARIFDGGNTWHNKADFVGTTTPTKGAPNNITLSEEDQKQAQTSTAQKTDAETKTDAKIIINELYPNPPGADLTAEFIELKNIGSNDVDLSGWQIKNTEKQTYKINHTDFADTIIKPGQFLMIYRQTSNLVLNNQKETIKLVSADDKTRQTVKYGEEENVPEDVSYALSPTNDWGWTTSPTPNQDNVINPLNHAPEIEIYCPKEAAIGELITCDASDSYDPDNDQLNFVWQVNEQTFPGPTLQYQFQQKGSSKIAITATDGQAESQETQTIKIKVPQSELDQQTVKISTLKKSTAKTPTINSISGTVSVLPNTFAKNLIYLANPDLQVYLSKADWPNLKLGDLVSVLGTMTTSAGEKRIKIAAAQNLKIIENKNVPEPKKIKANEIKEDLISALVQISGQVSKKETTTLFVQDETGRATVYLKPSTKINKNNYNEGENLIITGILKPKDNGLVIYPRSADDLSQIQTETVAKQPARIAPNFLNQQVLKYLIASLLFLSLGIAFVLYKKKVPGL